MTMVTNAATTTTMGVREADRATKRVNAALTRVMDDGGMAMSLARFVSEERGWRTEVWERIAEEFLFETVDEDDEVNRGRRGRPVRSRRWWTSER